MANLKRTPLGEINYMKKRKLYEEENIFNKLYKNDYNRNRSHQSDHLTWN